MEGGNVGSNKGEIERRDYEAGGIRGTPVDNSDVREWKGEKSPDDRKGGGEVFDGFEKL